MNFIMPKQENNTSTQDLHDVDVKDVDLEDQTRSASERLSGVDKKTFMFSGYIFWAMIFCAGMATAGVLLSRKSRKSTVTVPDTTPPTASPTPTRAPTLAPTPVPTPWPTPVLDPSMYSLSPAYPGSHYFVSKTLNEVFGEGNCSEMTEVEGYWKTQRATGGMRCSKQSYDFNSYAEYYWEAQGSKEAAIYLEVSYGHGGSSGMIYSDFYTDGCNIDCFEGYFDAIMANGN